MYKSIFLNFLSEDTYKIIFGLLEVPSSIRC